MASDRGDDDLTIRRATTEDRPAVIDLCRASLGWKEGDPNEAFFAWKHDQNPFGTSPAWVAETPDGRLVGLRMFLRWRFRRPDGTTFKAVRAVDTATHPDFQGRGIFTRLTLGALPELADEGVECVFNTPNYQSRPGYLKMGWQVVGRVPVAVRVRSALSMRQMAGARTAAEKWSRPLDVGLDAGAFLRDAEGLERLLARCARSDRIRTDLDAEYLHWRYSLEALRYRSVPLGDRLDDGVVVFRLRDRGRAIEATVTEMLVPGGGSAGAALAWILRHTGADYALVAHGQPWRSGAVPAPSLGPVLTWRPVTHGRVPALDELALGLGDVELF